MSSTNYLINVKNLKFQYDKKQVSLDIEKLTFPKNKIITLLGPSGSGKTTFLNLLIGFLKPTKGEIQINQDPEFSNFGFIMQDNNLYEEISVFKNVYLSAKNSSKWKSEVRNSLWIEIKNKFLDSKTKDSDVVKLDNLFAKYLKKSIHVAKHQVFFVKLMYTKILFYLLKLSFKNIKILLFLLENNYLIQFFFKSFMPIAKKLQIEEIINKKANNISGGQKQRVAFAKAIIKNTKLIFMDEPFAALDAKIKESTINWLEKIKKEFDLSIVLVTHDQTDALKISDYITVLNQGKVMQFGESEQLYNNPANLFVAKFLGFPEINFFKNQNGIDLYVRANKIIVSSNKQEGFLPFKIDSKKLIGESLLYKATSLNNENPISLNFLQTNNFETQSIIYLKINEEDLLKFDKEGQRVL
ncbi:ABC transporter ATP-binding protein [Mesomycoplasma hyorhinis]|uniref:ABC transporter ATP-binding protein n=1 Tax=Mesomycoplasma hyorhinis TaxID=2100 RepID=UPI001C05534B|nr:ABC transporter ATP-binding protein [Mesomycoplasma hyorhinis]